MGRLRCPAISGSGPANHGNIVLEVSWTIIPFLILAVMAGADRRHDLNLAKKPTGPT